MSYVLIVFPLLLAAVTFALPSSRGRAWLLPSGALCTLCLFSRLSSSPETAHRSPGWAVGCCSIRSENSFSAS